MNKDQFIKEAINTFEWLFDKNFITNRDGNIALKLDNSYLVSASGVNKPKMTQNDFIEVNSQSKIITSSTLDTYELRKPSIETQAHISALNSTDKLVSIHVHSPKTVALFEIYSRFYGNIGESFTGYLENEIMTNWPELFRFTKLGTTIPFLDPGSKELHDAISKSFLDKPDIIVLQRHGVLAVGKNLQEAIEHCIRLEHISSILLDIEKAK